MATWCLIQSIVQEGFQKSTNEHVSLNMCGARHNSIFFSQNTGLLRV